jgi:hypothetical protein
MKASDVGQSLWGNESAGGAGYCAGAGDDVPATG